MKMEPVSFLENWHLPMIPHGVKTQKNVIIIQSAINSLMNLFRGTGSVQGTNRSVALNVTKRVNECVNESGGISRYLKRILFLISM
jgi:hypothetical protein